MRNSPSCCAGKLIDKPSIQTCCRGVIVLKGQCSRRMGKCGRTLFNRKYERCCFRQVIPRRQRCRRRRCGRTNYMTFSHRCCNGKVIPRGQTCFPFPVKAKCGQVLFNPQQYNCCFQQLVPLHSACPTQSKCGNVPFNPQQYKCCFQQLVPLDSVCATQSMCGNVPFNPQRYKCCLSRVVPLRSPCSARTPCGHTFYYPQHQQCCNGQVLPASALCIPFKCGGLNFNPKSHKCCSGQIYPKSRCVLFRIPIDIDFVDATSSILRFNGVAEETSWLPCDQPVVDVAVPFLSHLVLNAAMETRLSLTLFGPIRTSKEHYASIIYGLSVLFKNIVISLYSLIVHCARF